MALSDALSTLTIMVHGATIVPLAVMLQKFGDRTDMFHKSLDAVCAAADRLRRRVAAELEADVAAAFPQPGAVAQAGPILDPAGNHITAFVQQPGHFPSSEAFRNCVHEFASRNEAALRGYSKLIDARDAWARWAKRISWCVLSLLAWELLAFAAIGVLAGLLKKTLPDWILLSSFAPTCTLALLFVVAFGGHLRNHDEILEVRRSHDAF